LRPPAGATALRATGASLRTDTLAVRNVSSRPIVSLTHRLLLASAAALALPFSANALPMAAQDSWMVMLDGSADAVELAANYALTRRDALGFATGRWEEMPHAGAPAAHALKREFAALTYTRQVHRWNLPHAQANIWLVGMLGTARAAEHDKRHTLRSLALLADAESTRLYASGALELMRAGPLRHDTAAVRGGFSFYEVEYEDVQPWLIIEAKEERFTQISKRTLTPMLRLIHRRYFLEIGGNRDGGVVNLMLTY
jgi:hypothetical protein